MGPARLESRAVTPSQSRCDIVRGGRQVAEASVTPWQVVDATG